MTEPQCPLASNSYKSAVTAAEGNTSALPL